MSSVCIIGDSRLTEFDDYIRRANENNLPIVVDADRGARLNRLATNTINCIHASKQTKVIIAGGINNCTFKDHQSGKFKFIFQSVEEMTEHIMYQFENADQQIRKIHSSAVVAYCDMIGMDLYSYPRCMNPLPGQQEILNLAIMEINRKIVNLNKRNKTITPWIAKTVHIPRKDGVHHTYERLDDGIHWDSDLKTSCAKRLVSAAAKLLE